jgi:hypothetical protein
MYSSYQRFLIIFFPAIPPTGLILLSRSERALYIQPSKCRAIFCILGFLAHYIPTMHVLSSTQRGLADLDPRLFGSSRRFRVYLFLIVPSRRSRRYHISYLAFKSSENLLDPIRILMLIIFLCTSYQLILIAKHSATPAQ